jgi:hypothetical protein
MPYFSLFLNLLITVRVLPQLAISVYFTVNLHQSFMEALSFIFAGHRQLRQHAVMGWFYLFSINYN